MPKRGRGNCLKVHLKETFKKGGEKSPPEGIDKKQSHYAQAFADSKSILKQVLDQ